MFEITRGWPVIILFGVLYLICWNNKRALKLLGLVMCTAAIVACPAFYYIIEYGGFPASLPLTMFIWVAVGFVGLLTYVTLLGEAKEESAPKEDDNISDAKEEKRGERP